MGTTKEPILELKNVKTTFKVPKGILKAVNGVDLTIYKGETVGLVGESGCGKSTLGKTIMRLYRPDEGQVMFEGQDIWRYNKKEKKEYTKNVQMIFQDPYACLDPLSVVSDIVAEGMKIHKMYKGPELEERVLELLKMVGLNKDHANRFPHEFSGGQRQRIGIARALSLEPKLIVCDEPISALDVSIQAQVVNLLKRLQQQMGLSYLFITHDLSMVRQISNRIAVMYLGSLVEIARIFILKIVIRIQRHFFLLFRLPIRQLSVSEKEYFFRVMCQARSICRRAAISAIAVHMRHSFARRENRSFARSSLDILRRVIVRRRCKFLDRAVEFTKGASVKLCRRPLFSRRLLHYF